MKKTFWTCLIALFAFSCADQNFQEIPDLRQKDVLPQISVQNDRLVFASSKDYFQTIDEIDAMEDDQIKNWKHKYQINSIHNLYLQSQSTDEGELKFDLQEFANFSRGYQSVLNSNAEVIIGDTIIWYNKGIKYFVPGKDEALLKEIRLNPSSAKLTAEYSLKLLNRNESIGNSGRIYPGPTQGVVAGGYQYTFAYCLNGTSRKYVNELYAVRDGYAPFPGGYTQRVKLFLRVKLEWLSSKGWKVAGEYRKINYNITQSTKFWFSYPYVSFPTPNYYVQNHTYNAERNSDLILTLFDTTGNTYNGDATFWDVEVLGYIEQSITNAYPPAPGGALCNTYRAPYAGAGTTALLW